MTRLFLAMTAISALAAPAAAQYQSQYPSQSQYPNQNRYPNQNQYPNQYNPNARGAVSFDQRIDRLEARIDAGVDARVIDRREARALRDEVRLLRQTELQYSRNGLTQQEHADLQQRLRLTRQNLRTADGGYRYDRYALDDDDDYYGQGGPENEWVIDESAQARTGVNGLFDTFLGGAAGLRVGQRAGTSLYGLQSEDRDQFRDTNSVYYRTDGNRVYEIDARTRTIIRVYRRVE